MKTKFGVAVLFSAIAAFFISGEALAASEKELKEPFKPLPKMADNPENKVTKDKVVLGRLLYFDPRLSKSGIISCAACHNLSTGGTDNLPTSIGHGWQIGPRNAPTVFNAALYGSQFWDGRAKDVEEQAGGPILNPKEMAASEELVIKRLKSIPDYQAMFKKAFAGEADSVTYTNVRKAIAAFERTLLTPSRFDAYLRGSGGLAEAEKRGLKTFVEKGCVGCHGGVTIGGASFKHFDYGSDSGRFAVTGNENDRKVFRVAPLRNVARTYPYFHDGSVWSLDEAVRIMGDKQLGVKLTDAETSDIVAFLNTLTGVVPAERVVILPSSMPSTPRPDVTAGQVAR